MRGSVRVVTYRCFVPSLLQVRKVMNALDNERESRATDMLLNYETIKYFCAEHAELSGYDMATRKYQVSVGHILLHTTGCYTAARQLWGCDVSV